VYLHQQNIKPAITMIPVTPCRHDSNHSNSLCLTFQSPLIYDCLASLLMTALDFEHSSLGKHKPLISALKIGWQAKACVAIARA
jgi:hypothetical protein